LYGFQGEIDQLAKKLNLFTKLPKRLWVTFLSTSKKSIWVIFRWGRLLVKLNFVSRKRKKEKREKKDREK
jgi:hypothetical protein